MNHSFFNYLDYTCLDRDSLISPDFLLALDAYRSFENCGFRESITSLNSLEFGDVVVSPNPSHSIIRVTNKYKKEIKFILFNSLGQAVISGDLASGANFIEKQEVGLYFLKIFDENENVSILKKIVFY